MMSKKGIWNKNKGGRSKYSPRINQQDTEFSVAALLLLGSRSPTVTQGWTCL